MSTNLTQQPIENNADFLAGDVVVFVDALKPDELMTVHKVQGNSVLLDGNRNFALNHLIRSASVAELNAKRRLLEEYWIDSNGKKWKTPQIKGRLKSRIPSHFALREFVIERDGYKCQHCGSMDRKKLVADHILSRRNGGSHHPSNLQRLCDSCNARKAGLVDSKVTSNG